MVTPGPTRIVVTLCMLLLAAPALAGCTDKANESSGPTPNPFVTRTTEDVTADPLAPYARHYAGPPAGECEGCIRLETPDARDRHTHPTIETVPGVTVPLPLVGDRLDVSGVRRSPTGIELGGLPFPLEDDAYRFELAFESVTTTVPATAADATVARFVMAPAAGAYAVDDAAFLPYHAELLVDLRTHAVVAFVSEGHSAARAGAHIGTHQDTPDAAAVHTRMPTAANLFWLGAHLWGRTLYEDDTFRFAWRPPGAEEPALFYDYRVLHAETAAEGPPAIAEPDGAPHSHAEAAAEPHALVVRVDVHDHFGKTRRWELRFQPDSPYPEVVRLTRNTHASVDRSLVPPEIGWQVIQLRERGSGTVAWSLPAGDRPAAAPAWGGSMFRIDERPASPALDAMPVYPLTGALEDLRRLEPSFQEWWRLNPAATLVDARLEPRLLSSGAGATVEYEWTLTFLHDGHLQGWTVARLALGVDGVAPTAHRAASAAHADVPNSIRLMDPGEHVHRRLAAGDGLGAALAVLGVTAPVDRIHYALTHSREEGLGGWLLVGAAHHGDEPGAPDATGTAGYVVQDLTTGAVVDALAYGS